MHFALAHDLQPSNGINFSRTTSINNKIEPSKEDLVAKAIKTGLNKKIVIHEFEMVYTTAGVLVLLEMFLQIFSFWEPLQFKQGPNTFSLSVIFCQKLAVVKLVYADKAMEWVYNKEMVCCQKLVEDAQSKGESLIGHTALNSKAWVKRKPSDIYRNGVKTL